MVCASIGILIPATDAEAAAAPLTFAAPLRVDGSGGFTGISCVSTALCVAVDNSGAVVDSVNPTSATPAWQVADVDGSNAFTGVSCPTVSLCVAVDDVGNVISSTDPNGGDAAWHVVSIDPGQDFTSISCPGTFCVATDGDGRVATTIYATGGPPQWKILELGDQFLVFTGVSCVGLQCVAVDTRGEDFVSATDPFDASGWTSNHIDPTTDFFGDQSSLTGISCPSTSFCVAVDDAGNAVTSTDPISGPWTPELINGHHTIGGIGLSAVSCASAAFCAAVDGIGEVTMSTNPTGGPSAWIQPDIDSDNPIYGISCPTASFCVAADTDGDVLIGTPTPAPPAVTGVSPTSGPVGGGTTVTITGSGFTGATGVMFGTIPATNAAVVSDTTITAVSPAGTAGVSDVTVSTPSGTSSPVTADQFTYTSGATPAITAVSPASGPSTGGTTVTITGTGFTGATKVTFGGVAATSFTVNSATKITAVSPAGIVGVRTVRVTTPVGETPVVTADDFTYTSPTPAITALSPTSGPSNGGTTVTITGTGFTGATKVTFGGVAAPSFTVDSATKITAVSPAGIVGVRTVRVTTPVGESPVVTADDFTYTSST
jgi:hypothetical protein